MIWTPIEAKVVKLAYDNLFRCKQRARLLSFITERNRIWSFGWNSYSTHPLSHKFNYWDDVIHSEVSCLIRYKRKVKTLASCTMYNVRIDRYGHLKMSKPCLKCQDIVRSFGVGELYYTNNDGKFERLV